MFERQKQDVTALKHMLIWHIFFLSMLNNVPKHQEFLIVSLKHIKNETNIDHIQPRVCLLTSEFVAHQSSLDQVTLGVLVFPYFSNSEYDQEIPQSQTADNPVALRGRVAQPSRDTRKTN